MPGAEWLNNLIDYVRQRARIMRAPVHWHPAPPQKPNFSADRYGNHTVRPHQQVTSLRAADASGREWIILEIVPVEPIEGYDHMRFVHGRARYELKDGTPVVQHSPTTFEVGGNKLTIAP